MSAPVLLAVAVVLGPSKSSAAAADDYPGLPKQGEAVSRPPDRRARNWLTNDLTGWLFIKEGGAQGSMAQDAANPLNERNPNSLRLSVTNLGSRCGIATSDRWGMNVQAGQWYDATFYARKDIGRGVGLVFSLESTNGKVVCARATIPEVGAQDWRPYTLALHAYGSDPHCRLVIIPIEPCTIWLDLVSLEPREDTKDRADAPRGELKQQQTKNP